MKITTQQKFNRTKTALAVGVALFAVSELGLATYETHSSSLTATADTAEADDEAITIDVLANDGEANAATLAIGTQPTQGTISISAGQVVYTPNEDFSGTDTFTYTVEEKEWRKNEAGAFTVTSYSMAVDATAPIAATYSTTNNDGDPINVDIFNGTFTAPGFWNEQPKGNGVVGKSWKPSSSVAQLQGCNTGDDTATPISLTMIWSGERRASTNGPGNNQFTITTDQAPTPDHVEGDGIVLEVFNPAGATVTSSAKGAGSFVTDTGNIEQQGSPWKFTTTSIWSNLTAAEFEAMPITILASTYNNKSWYSTSTSFNANIDYSTCKLNTATATVTITAKESSGGGGGGTMGQVAMFALGLFGLNALRRRRQA